DRLYSHRDACVRNLASGRHRLHQHDRHPVRGHHDVRPLDVLEQVAMTGRRHDLRTQRGMTAIEMAVVLMVISAILIVCVPAFNDLADKYRLKSMADSIHSDLQFARSEAIRTNKAVCVGFTTGANWCYGMNYTTLTGSNIDKCDASCDCSITNTADTS